MLVLKMLIQVKVFIFVSVYIDNV